MVNRPERPSHRHVQAATHSHSHVTLRTAFLCSSSHAYTSFRFLQPLTSSVCFHSLSLLDHSWRISGAPLIKSGTRGGMLHGNPPSLAVSSRRQQLNSPGFSRRRQLQTRLCPRIQMLSCRTTTARMPSLRPTPRLKMPLLSYPGPPCHTAASVPKLARTTRRSSRQIVVASML